MKSSEDLNAIRVIFGEADFLPGLVVDKYADVLVVECLALGMELLKKEILTYLIAIMGSDGFSVRAVFERSDAPVRKKEGLFPYKGLLYLDGKWLSDLSDVEAEIKTKNVSLITEELIVYKLDLFKTDFLKEVMLIFQFTD